MSAGSRRDIDEALAALKAIDADVKALMDGPGDDFTRALSRFVCTLDGGPGAGEMHIFMAGALWARRWHQRQ